MPTHIRAQVQWNVGSMLPRDVVQITPCFRHSADLSIGGVDWQPLADDLATVIDTWMITHSNQVTVKLYKIGEPRPNRPAATSVKNVGLSSEAPVPREIACCLSFYGGPNAPHNRGRLYVPPWFAVSLTAGVPARPTVTIRDKIGTLSSGFAGLGGVNVDWIVWSPTRSQATKVDHWFVDDEWDTQRRRGLKAVARSAGTTSG